ncbi:WO male-killing family protein Wmk [Wolbachia endosymbiont (group A) of Lasioglossum morio]|uniref:WO male-killing family protein Wmk n=1 Tax=Wolbachia endosymbiont (group A) of Lasioglossum morio TaxID=2954025 RepID=UPI002227E814|nr:helix-turn-helix domain-containing protein [Wolbachia endosymbiont (group A) of Lasioglossum morio]
MTASNINSSRIKHTNATRYKIAQKIRSWRLKRGYTLKALADKTGIKYYTLLKYEQGVQGIPTKDIKRLADAFSTKAGTLFPRRKVLRENCCFDKAKEQAIYNLTAQTRTRESRKAIYALTQSVRAQKESNAKEARVRIAQNLLKAGFSIDIIYQATGLLVDEYDDKEKKIPKRQNEGEEIKNWRIVQGYAQEYLAEKLGVSRSKIHNCEQGNVIILGETLWGIAVELSKDVDDLITKPTKEDYYEDSEGENERLSLARECQKIDDQESLDELGIWVEFLSQRRQIYKEKIDKVESIKVANNLLILGVSVDAISSITGLPAEEITQPERN